MPHTPAARVRHDQRDSAGLSASFVHLLQPCVRGVAGVGERGCWRCYSLGARCRRAPAGRSRISPEPRNAPHRV